ncbi:helix-turn-helix domain-containing protein [Sphingomonas sp. ERG5]|uniref:helix-turn-helix domain-containing protein n=1 Tax=Sphingomonas sp. ERG5 TaxID=1381597 RepID=UPI0006901626|nr:helix-turn-helix transcriptional regulator [Sphingomonas sp. ERG5]
MSDDRLDQLSARQRECLRLVGQGKRTKDIARLLGRSHHTIHRDIENATRLLGAATRFEAADRLRDPVGGDDEPFVNEPRDLVAPRDFTAHRPSQPPPVGDGRQAGVDWVREEHLPFVHSTPHPPPPPWAEQERAGLYDLINRHRMIVSIIATFLLVALVAGFLAIAHELQQLLIGWTYPS